VRDFAGFVAQGVVLLGLGGVVAQGAGGGDGGGVVAAAVKNAESADVATPCWVKKRARRRLLMRSHSVLVKKQVEGVGHFGVVQASLGVALQFVPGDFQGPQFVGVEVNQTQICS
jgi:hypothetical protein